jgi:hypothetical protein
MFKLLYSFTHSETSPVNITAFYMFEMQLNILLPWIFYIVFEAIEPKLLYTLSFSPYVLYALPILYSYFNYHNNSV